MSCSTDIKKKKKRLLNREVLFLINLGCFMSLIMTESIYNSAYSVWFNPSVMIDSLRPRRLQHARLSCPSPIHRAYSNSCHQVSDAIPSSVIRFSSCLQSCQASASFLVGQFFTSGGKSIGVSASASVFSVNTQN